jgi:hypothetical protein
MKISHLATQARTRASFVMWQLWGPLCTQKRIHALIRQTDRRHQGCQIFHRYMIPKPEKLPNDHTISPMSVKYYRWS